MANCDVKVQYKSSGGDVCTFFLVWKDSWVSLKGRISRLPEQPLTSRLDYSTAALTTPQKVLPIWKQDA